MMNLKSTKQLINHMKPNGKIIILPKSNTVVSANKKATLRQRDQHVKEIPSKGVFEWRKPLDMINKVKLKNHFIDTKQSLEII